MTMRWQFSIRTLLLFLTVASVGMVAYRWLYPGPPLRARSHIAVSFEKNDRGDKRIDYSVCLRSQQGHLSKVTFRDFQPCDGQLDYLMSDVRAKGTKWFSNTPMFPGPPPTARMLAVFERIQKTIAEPLKTREVVWLDKSTQDDEYHRIVRNGLHELIVALPDDEATRDAFSVLDDAGNPLP